MAGSLVQVNKTVSDGSDTTLKVTGIDSDDVYLLVLKLIQTQNNNEVINMTILTINVFVAPAPTKAKTTSKVEIGAASIS